MTKSEIVGLAERQLRSRMKFAIDAFTLREIRGWPNDPIHNPAIVYELHGWPFDAKDAAMIEAETRARATRYEETK